MLKRNFVQALFLICTILLMILTKVGQASDMLDSENTLIMESKRTKLMTKDESIPLAQLRSDLLSNSNVNWEEVIAAKKKDKYYRKRGYGKHTRHRSCGNKTAQARIEEQRRAQERERIRVQREAEERERIRVQREVEERAWQEQIQALELQSAVPITLQFLSSSGSFESHSAFAADLSSDDSDFEEQIIVNKKMKKKVFKVSEIDYAGDAKRTHQLEGSSDPDLHQLESSSDPDLYEQENLVPFQNTGSFNGEELAKIEDTDRRIIEGEELGSNPYKFIGIVNITFPNGKDFGTGTLVGPNHVLTCAHNLFNFSEKKWAQRVTFKLPAKKEAYDVCKILICKKYRTEGQLHYLHDIGLMILNQPVGGDWLGIMAANELSTFNISTIEVSGYPGDKFRKKGFKGNPDMWTAGGSASHECDKRMIIYDFDTFSGQSGSPIISKEVGYDIFLAGVHTGGSIYNTDGSDTAAFLVKFQYHLQHHYRYGYPQAGKGNAGNRAEFNRLLGELNKTTKAQPPFTIDDFKNFCDHFITKNLEPYVRNHGVRLTPAKFKHIVRKIEDNHLEDPSNEEFLQVVSNIGKKDPEIRELSDRLIKTLNLKQGIFDLSSLISSQKKFNIITHAALSYVRDLDLSKNGLTDLNLATLLKKSLPVLVSMNLEDNEITDNGAAIIVRADLPKLSRLNIQHNQITSKGIKVLFEFRPDVFNDAGGLMVEDSKKLLAIENSDLSPSRYPSSYPSSSSSSYPSSSSSSSLASMNDEILNGENCLSVENCPKNLIASSWASVSSYGGEDDDINEAHSILDDKGFEMNAVEYNESLALRIETWEHKDANNLIISFRGTVLGFPNIYSDIAVAKYAVSNVKENYILYFGRIIKDNLQNWYENGFARKDDVFVNSCESFLVTEKITPESFLVDTNKYALGWVNKYIDKIDREHHLNITYTGHSLGGFIANTVSELSLRTPSSSIVFNAPCGVQKFIEEHREDILVDYSVSPPPQSFFSWLFGYKEKRENHDFRKMTINISRYRDTVGRIGGDDVCRRSLLVSDHRMNYRTDPKTYIVANHNIGNLARYLSKNFDF